MTEMGWSQVPRFERGSLPDLDEFFSSKLMIKSPSLIVGCSNDDDDDGSNSIKELLYRDLMVSQKSLLQEIPSILRGTIDVSSPLLCFALGDEDSLIAGSVDKHLYIFPRRHDDSQMDGYRSRRIGNLHDGPILSVSVHPQDHNLLLTSSMDKRHCLVDLSGSPEDHPSSNGNLVKRFRDHEKYVVKVEWSPCGGFFGSASYDHSFNLYSFAKDENAGYECSKVELIESYKFHANVESFVFCPALGIVIVAVREDNNLHFIDLMSGTIERKNMNVNGDNWVSFSVMHLTLSPRNPCLLMASTDSNKLLLFCLQAKPNRNVQLLLTFYDIPNDPLTSQPRHVWHPNGKVVYSICDHKNSVLAIQVIQDPQAKRLTLMGHQGSVRNLIFDETNNCLYTCSFDKTLRSFITGSH